VRAKHRPESNRSRLCGCVALVALAASIYACHSAYRVTLTVSAAASLQDAISEVEGAYQQRIPNVEFCNNFGSSGNLAAQIEQGAPADMFLSSAARPMDDLEGKGLIAAGTRRNLLRNSLVLIAPRDSRLQDFQGLASNSVRLIALGDPQSVPVGEYGRADAVVASSVGEAQREAGAGEGCPPGADICGKPATRMQGWCMPPMHGDPARCALLPSRRNRRMSRLSIPWQRSGVVATKRLRESSSITLPVRPRRQSSESMDLQ